MLLPPRIALTIARKAPLDDALSMFPIQAAYVINGEGRIRIAFVEPYFIPQEPKATVEVVRALASLTAA